MKGSIVRSVRHGGAALAIGLGLLRAGAQAPEPAPQGIGTSFRPPPGALIAPGRSPDAFLLFTGDVVGFVDPCG